LAETGVGCGRRGSDRRLEPGRGERRAGADVAWGAPQPVQETPPLNACQPPPTQPPYPYDKNVCCKQPDTWQQECTDEAATLPTNSMPGSVVCISSAYVCKPRPPRRP
jgi:hypothetical protein